MDENTASELRLKPGGFWRHDLAGIGDMHQIIQCGRIHGKSHAAVFVDKAFQL